MYFEQVFQRLFNFSTFKYYERMGGNVTTCNPEDFRTFMKAHEADWYKSDEFAEMFVKCPADALPFVARKFYGNGQVVKQEVNLSERVVECLKAAFEQFNKEQHTFPSAFIVEMTLKAFGVEINKEETETC